MSQELLKSHQVLIFFSDSHAESGLGDETVTVHMADILVRILRAVF